MDILLDAIGNFDDYVLISSSAVYLDYAPQPFTENTPTFENKFCGKYGIGKFEDERAMLSRIPKSICSPSPLSVWPNE